MSEIVPQSNNLLQFLQTLLPYLSSDMKKEVKALIELFDAFNVDNVKNLSVPILEMQKKFRKSPEGIAARVKDYRNAKEQGVPFQESLEDIVVDFRKLSSTNVKILAQQLKINLTDKKDESLFIAWLQTGITPPSQEERLHQELQADIMETVRLYDEMESMLVSENIDKIIAIAESVYKRFKLDGLKLLIKSLQLVPVGKTKKAIITAFRGSLHEIAISQAIIN